MTTPSFRLDHRVAVVTGSASGLGKSIAAALAEMGAEVVGIDIAEEANRRVADTIGGAAVTLDVADPEPVDQAVADLVGRWGRIDVLVNSAGIGGRGAAVDYPPERLARVLDVNVKGTLYMCQAVGRIMISQGGGSIINIASIGGLVGFPGSVGYQASKGGVVQMTRTLAVEWGPSNVRVNAIAPGHIGTELVQQQWETEPHLKDFFLTRTPLGRLGKPEDVAGSAVFLAGDAARMITGQIIAVDGGYTAQ
ncbi:MAG: SDR family oxidoreductase [bacterium]|nr:SDR family oxidoreductase [bacterium]MDE0642872.1 SDR family oxidoreductase [bacterium]